MAARRERDVALRPSVLDRLMAAPISDDGRPRAQLEAIGLRELYRAVQRDLEWLLNSKRWSPDPPEDLPHANESIWSYGLPDLSAYAWRNQSDVNAIARVLEEVIRCFEPRLRSGTVKVTPLPASAEPDDFRMRFRIDAVLHVEPVRASVSFDTDIDFPGNTVTVRGQS